MSFTTETRSCEVCHSSDNVVVDTEGGWHCFTPGCDNRSKGNMTTFKKAPKIKVPYVPRGKFRQLQNRGISEATCTKYLYHYSKYAGTMVKKIDGKENFYGSVDNPVEVAVMDILDDNGKVVWQKLRGPNKSFKAINAPAEGCGLIGKNFWESGKRKLIVTEGVEDMMAVAQATDFHYNVASLPGGGGSVNSSFKIDYDDIMRHDNIIAFFDKDKAGFEALEAIKKIVPPYKLSVVDVKDKDACEMLVKENGSSELKFSIIKAQPTPPAHLIKGVDITLEELRKPLRAGYRLKTFPGLDRALNGFALGELTIVAGGCVDKDTEYLTPYGWKKIAEYDGKLVGQYNKDGSMSFVQPERYIKEPCNEFIYLNTKYGVSQKLSDEHRCLYLPEKRSDGEFIEVKAKELTSGFRGRFKTNFYSNEGQGMEMSDGELRLQVAVIADGYFSPKSLGTNWCTIRIKKQRKIDRLAEILKSCNKEFKVKHEGSTGFSIFRFNSFFRVKTFVSDFYKCNQKQLNLISEECLHWDGNGKDTFYTNNKESADFIQYCFTTSGHRGSISTYDRTQDKDRTRGIEHVVHRTKRNLIGLRGSEVTRIKSLDGLKYCFTVPSGMLILRCEDNIFITGNSGLGKTDFVTRWQYELVTRHKLKVDDIKIESPYNYNALQFIAMDNHVPFKALLEHPSLLTDEQVQASREKMFPYMNFFKHEGICNVKSLMDLLNYCAVINKSDFIFIDNLTIAFSSEQSSKDGERKDIDLFMGHLEHFVMRTGVSVVLVAHLKNPGQGKTWKQGKECAEGDIRGSGNITNMAFNVIAIEGQTRAFYSANGAKPFDPSLRWVRVIKSRYGKEFDVLTDVYRLNEQTWDVEKACFPSEVEG